MLENLKEEIAEILKSQPSCRNSDITLTIEVWKRFYPKSIFQVNVSGTSMSEDNGIDYQWDDVVRLKDLYNLPREDNIKRVRAKFQELAVARLESGKLKGDERYYLPTDEKVARHRKISAAIWQKALGYFRAPLKQTTQLDSPVGKLGFSMVKENQYLVNGERGKKYNVILNHGAFWECECEAYRYSKKKTCKHCKSVADYLKKQTEAEAAKNQANLF